MDPQHAIDDTVAVLRAHGAAFAYLFGSRASHTHRPDSDVDIAAWFPGDAPCAFDLAVPDGVDLVVLNTAPLEFAGRIALDGTLLFADDMVAWARWTSTTRKFYLDEKPRMERAHMDFLDSVNHGR